jgi:hypothetical protein
MSSFRFLISLPPSVYQRKCSSQLKAPQCSSKLLTYANESSLIMSITGHTTRVLSSAILVIKLSSQPGHKITEHHFNFGQNLCTLKDESSALQKWAAGNGIFLLVYHTRSQHGHSRTMHNWIIWIPSRSTPAAPFVMRPVLLVADIQCVPLVGSPWKCWFTQRTKVQYICMSYL